MNMDQLSIVKFGDVESLNEFLFENGLQHRLFAQAFSEQNILVPQYPIMDAYVENLDDWLQIHQIEHQAFSAQLGIDNPFNLLDVDFNDETSFYDWLSIHLNLHEQIVASLGL